MCLESKLENSRYISLARDHIFIIFPGHLYLSLKKYIFTLHFPVHNTHLLHAFGNNVCPEAPEVLALPLD